MASKKQELPKSYSQELEQKQSEVVVEVASEAKPKQRVVLNRADCNLDFDIKHEGLQGSDLHREAFAYCWSGARANVGIIGGKYCFGCTIVSNQRVIMEDTTRHQAHDCRVGISRGDGAVENLGETEHSFGFWGTGKFSNSGRCSGYGENFRVGDTIVCAVNFEDKPWASIGFSKNGKWLGIAMQFDPRSKGIGIINSPSQMLQWESALYPHLLLKNVVVSVQFSVEDGLIPEKGYKPWSSALEDGNAVLGPIFSNVKDCEVMVMVGLPASGKTTWAEKWVKEHPEKRYVLLGTNLVLNQMKVPILLRNNYGEQFECLMSRATAIFRTLLSRAAKIPRNYVVDDANVDDGVRKLNFRPFFDWQRIAVVIFPKPEEFKIRAEERFREMGKEVPYEAVKQMLAYYDLPTSMDMPDSDDIFHQVLYPELNREESLRHLAEMTRASSSASDMKMTSHSLCSGESTFHGYIQQRREAASVTSGPCESSCSRIRSPLLIFEDVKQAFRERRKQGDIRR